MRTDMDMRDMGAREQLIGLRLAVAREVEILQKSLDVAASRIGVLAKEAELFSLLADLDSGSE